MTPTVSVVIPAYNSTLFIEATLESVMAQTYPDYEVIVVNDGSPDTPAFERAISPYRHRITYIVQANAGAAAARNTALRAAGGCHVAFLDADDIWQPNYLSEQVGFLEREGYDLVYCDAQMFGNDQRRYMEACPSNGAVTFQSLIDGTCNVITSGCMVRREVIISAGLFDMQFHRAQDFELWLRLAYHGALMNYQPKVLLSYRVHAGSLSGDAIDRVERELRVLHWVLATYGLLPEERASVCHQISVSTGVLEREIGRQYLLRGNAGAAASALVRAQNLHPSWKQFVTLWMLRVFPETAVCIARQRASRATKTPEQ